MEFVNQGEIPFGNPWSPILLGTRRNGFNIISHVGLVYIGHKGIPLLAESAKQPLILGKMGQEIRDLSNTKQTEILIMEIRVVSSQLFQFVVCGVL